MIEGTEKPFPFNINNAIKISGNKSSNIEELWNLAIKNTHSHTMSIHKQIQLLASYVYSATILIYYCFF